MNEKNLIEVKNFLKQNLTKDFMQYYGLQDSMWLDRATNNYFDDKNNYDGRWNVIKERIPKVGRILDMAAGCGTFLFYGLHNGYDVWGIEPEYWKKEYIKKKGASSNYPAWFLQRFVVGFGEALPFRDESFDLVTTYQTLEHVHDLAICILEMLRVLKPGGILFIISPDYNSFFEPHYRIPFLPKMNRRLASIYLKFLGRPRLGLQTLNWVTRNEVLEHLKNSNYQVHVENTTDHFAQRQTKIRAIMPPFLRNPHIIRFLNFIYEKKLWLVKFGRQENFINLWVTKP